MFRYICRHRPHCRLLESQARWIFQQLIIGLDYCHNKVRLKPPYPAPIPSWKAATACCRPSRKLQCVGHRLLVQQCGGHNQRIQ